MVRSMTNCVSLSLALLVTCPAAANDLRISNGVMVMRGDERVTIGSGNPVRRPRPAVPFSRIEAGDGVNVEVVIGARPSIYVEADDNLIDRVAARVESGILKIGFSGSYRTSRAPIVHIVMPAIESIRLATSSGVVVDSLTGGDLRIAGNGSGDIRLHGRLNSIALELNGSSAADLRDLEVRDVAAAVNGNANVRVNPGRSLSAEVNGNGSVVYGGNPLLLKSSRRQEGVCHVDRRGGDGG